MFKAACKLLIIIVLFLSVFVSVPLVSGEGEPNTFTIVANSSECAAVSVSVSYYSDVFTSFPVSFGIYTGITIYIGITAQEGYVFNYADTGFSSFLTNTFSFIPNSDVTLTLYFSVESSPTSTPLPTPTITPMPPSNSSYSYTFYGVFDEDNINNYLGNVTVTAYYSLGSVGIGNYSVESFTVASSYVYTPVYKPLYFSYNLAKFADQNITRQYWLGESENSATIYLTYPPTVGITPITFNIRALGGLNFENHFLIAKRLYSNNIVEKIPIDSLGNAIMMLKPYALYVLSIENGVTFTFGNVETSATTITLTVSPLSFPSDVLLQYRYLTLYASRPNPTEIMISYNDANNQTVSVSYTVTASNGTVVYSYTEYSSSFSDVWTGADSEENYYISATVVQSEFGTSTFKQVLAAGSNGATQIDLSVLGNFGGIDATQIIGALIVLIVFGCFSAVNAYIGIFAGVATGAIMLWIGWLDIPQSIIVAAFALCILLAITYWKRRGG